MGTAAISQLNLGMLPFTPLDCRQTHPMCRHALFLPTKRHPLGTGTTPSDPALAATPTDRAIFVLGWTE